MHIKIEGKGKTPWVSWFSVMSLRIFCDIYSIFDAQSFTH